MDRFAGVPNYRILMSHLEQEKPLKKDLIFLIVSQFTTIVSKS
jgi:hypothetical protein